MIIVVISFNYSCNQETLSDLAMDYATNVKPNVEGLIWKIYLNDPDRRRSAGIYLFRDLQCANAYIKGSYVHGLRHAPIVSNVSTETFQMMHEPSIRSGASTLIQSLSGYHELTGALE